MANRETVGEREFQGGTYRLELVDCGNERCLRCGGGPSHGPYWYRYYRWRGKLISRYVGKELPAELARRSGGDDTAPGDDIAGAVAAGATAAAGVQAAAAGPGEGPEDEQKAPPDPVGRPQTDEEYSRTLRHRQVAGLGPEWTYTETSGGGDVILWYRKATRAGGARSAWPKSGWEPVSPQGFRLPGGPQPSRVKALRAAAAGFERRRRKETPAGLDIPMPGAGGWKLRQTLAEKDARAWQVIAPGNTAVGTVRPSYSGARSWTASHGAPGSGFPVTVSPVAGGGEQVLAAGDGSDWKTRDAAAYAVAHEHDPDGTPAPAEAVARAAAERRHRQELRAGGQPS